VIAGRGGSSRGPVWAVRQIAVFYFLILEIWGFFVPLVPVDCRYLTGGNGMESAITAVLKSPAKKLIAFFQSSRDKWKSKYFAKRDQAILLANQVRAVEKSREHWRTVAEDAKREIKDLKIQLKKS
jgi:hypothetical protein